MLCRTKIRKLFGEAALRLVFAASCLALPSAVFASDPTGHASERQHLEGELGWRGQLIAESQEGGATSAVGDPTLCPDATNIAYRFAGVSDDGKKGAADRKEATSLLCQNIHTENVAIKYQLFQWSGALVAEACVTASPNQTFTFSTQNTTIYFDDVILGEGGGTDSIFQGAGMVLIDRGSIVCSAQVLDPLTYPPVFAVRLPLWGACGYHNNVTLETTGVVGTEEFVACRQITARGAFSVEPGGDVVFRSGSEITLGGGFSVSEGASFEVIVDSSLPAR